MSAAPSALPPRRDRDAAAPITEAPPSDSDDGRGAPQDDLDNGRGAPSGEEPPTGAPSSGDAFVSVSVGLETVCGLRASGRVDCWTPSLPGDFSPPGRFIAVAAGVDFACGIHRGGALECWGESNLLGLPEGSPPVFGADYPPAGFPWPGERFISLSVGSVAVCAIRADASAVCSADWDDPDPGTAPAAEGGFVSVSTGSGRGACGVRADQGVTCWGADFDDSGSAPGGVFDSVAVGSGYACGVRVGGSVACWGYNSPGEPPAGGQGFVAVSAGFYFACGLRLDGDVGCWGLQRCGPDEWGCSGWNEHGEPTPEGPFVSVDVAPEFTGTICGVRASGDVVCWNDGSGTR